MATGNEKLTQSLEILHGFQGMDTFIKGNQLSRTHRERLINAGYLSKIMKGWYLITSPDQALGTTQWYHIYWRFIAKYVTELYGLDWYLNEEQSLSVQTGDLTVPRQLMILTPKGINKPIQLMHDCTLFSYKPANFYPERIRSAPEGIQLMSMDYALVHMTPTMYTSDPTTLQIALSMYPQPGPLISILLAGGHTVLASRLIGAYKHTGNAAAANQIKRSMHAAGHVVREENPFEVKLQKLVKPQDPVAGRIEIMWNEYRDVIAGMGPKPSKTWKEEEYLESMKEIYTYDAYHSLSIEGYKVSEELIEKVRSGTWDPQKDKEDRDAMAAAGYYRAFQSVIETVGEIFRGNMNPAIIVEDWHQQWYLELFGPSVTAGILPQETLIGYRNMPVYIRGSRHVPPNFNSVANAMNTFFWLLSKEQDPFVRAVLGHFVFVFIHPYGDGNGRMARFLMNCMIAAAGYKWLVIKVDDRFRYMQALESASAGKNILPFASFVKELIQENERGE